MQKSRLIGYFKMARSEPGPETVQCEEEVPGIVSFILICGSLFLVIATFPLSLIFVIKVVQVHILLVNYGQEMQSANAKSMFVVISRNESLKTPYTPHLVKRKRVFFSTERKHLVTFILSLKRM